MPQQVAPSSFCNPKPNMMFGNRLVKLFCAKIFQRLSSDQFLLSRFTLTVTVTPSICTCRNFSSVFNAIFQQRQELVWKFTLLDFLFLFVCSCLQAKTQRGKSGPTLPRAPRCLLPPIHTLPPALPGAGSGRGPSENLNLSSHPPQHL